MQDPRITQQAFDEALDPRAGHRAMQVVEAQVAKSRERKVTDLAKTIAQGEAAGFVSEDEIEVKYTPNRAERRARQQALKRSVRRGVRAQDRKIAEMKRQMTREEIDRAALLAAKQAQIDMLREASGRG